MADDDEASLDRAREARKNLGMWSFTFTMRSPETVTDHEKAAIRRFRAAQAAKGCGVDAILDKLNFRKFLDVVDAWNVGDEVIVHGLLSAVELNGESGVMESVDTDGSGRLRVKLSTPRGTMTHVNAKPDNVAHVDENYEGAYTLTKRTGICTDRATEPK